MIDSKVNSKPALEKCGSVPTYFAAIHLGLKHGTFVTPVLGNFCTNFSFSMAVSFQVRSPYGKEARQTEGKTTT